ncbi:MAG: hypothetical protein PHC97_00720 [Patescibacteria group bacterium]|nr:hypothetical protein [Patescibacteria group bacterium]
MNDSIESLGHLLGQDLAGWQIAYYHCLKLKHGLMGYFPAITTATVDATEPEIVGVLDKKLLRKVWQTLPKREAKIDTLLVLANTEKGIAFDLKGDVEIMPLKIFSKKEIDELLTKENPFRWSPGLIGGKEADHVSDPDFG